MDNVMSCMVTVADVEVSGDLQVVKVFVSILGDEREEERHQRIEEDGGLRASKHREEGVASAHP